MKEIQLIRSGLLEIEHAADGESIERGGGDGELQQISPIAIRA